MPRGRFIQGDITRAEPVKREAVIEWVAHYGIGCTFAALLLAIYGPRLDKSSNPAACVRRRTWFTELVCMLQRWSGLHCRTENGFADPPLPYIVSVRG